MKKTFLHLAPIIGLLLLTSSCNNQLKNIGCVEYTKARNGNIEANWAFLANDKTTTGTGIGIVQGTPSASFEGHYFITYTAEGGAKDSFDLFITPQSHYFQLEWKKPNTDTEVYYGIGIEKDGKLVVGWRE